MAGAAVLVVPELDGTELDGTGELDAVSEDPHAATTNAAPQIRTRSGYAVKERVMPTTVGRRIETALCELKEAPVDQASLPDDRQTLLNEGRGEHLLGVVEVQGDQPATTRRRG